MVEHREKKKRLELICERWCFGISRAFDQKWCFMCLLTLRMHFSVSVDIMQHVSLRATMFVYAVKCESNMVVTTIQTNWCRYENRKTFLFLSSVGISSFFKNMFAMKLRTQQHSTSTVSTLESLCVSVCLAFFWSFKTRGIFHTHILWQPHSLFTPWMKHESQQSYISCTEKCHTVNSMKYYYVEITFSRFLFLFRISLPHSLICSVLKI